MKLLKDYGWLVAVALVGYLGWVTVTPYKRAVEAHELFLTQWGNCVKVNPDKSLGWICEIKQAKADTPPPPQVTAKK